MAYRDELRAALDRAEAAERRLEAVCAVHPQAPVAATCALCQKALCTACTMVSIAGTFCGACFVKERQRELRRRLLVVTTGVSAVVVSVLGAIWFWRPPPAVAPPPPPPEARVPTPDEVLANRRVQLAERLAKDPCNRTVTLDLAESLNHAKEYASTIALTDEFLAKCGAFPRLLWTAYAAHQERGEWEKAAARAAELIVTEPTDMDYWWWRGEAFQERGYALQASADFRQAMALGAMRVGAWRLSWVAEAIGRPCEAAFGFSAAFDEDDDLATDSAEQRRGQLWTAGDCGNLEARGATEIRFKPGHADVSVDANVAGTRGHFVVERSAGLVVLTRAFAERAGVTSSDPTEIWVLAAGKVLPAHVATVPSIAVGDAHAPQIDVAIVDALPGKLDGILGQSFLWRFSSEWGDDRLTLAPR